MKNPHFVCVFLLIDFTALALSQCTGTKWTAYKKEKCVKIVEMLETAGAALKICQSLDASSSQSDSTLLTIGSEEEQLFLNNLLFNNANILGNVWLGAKRTGGPTDFAWLDGTKIDRTVYSNWAPDNPVSDVGNNCVEFRSTNSLRSKESKQSPGSWYNVPCANKNVVVCQKPQDLSPSEIRAELSQVKQDVKSLKEKLQAVDNAIFDLVKQNQQDRTQINDLIKQNQQDRTQINDLIKQNQQDRTQINDLVKQNQQDRAQINDLIKQNQQDRAQIDDLIKKNQVNSDQINQKGKDIETLRGDIKKVEQSTVYDIKFLAPENKKLFKGPGFPDTQSFVITGIVNDKSDETLDTVYRRKMQKLINGKWTDI